ncbi:hypothetical protein [Lacipirellula limnantheis]|uniref:hypothetical protein n=1 Tax=Lacipirellula limnantheis TaxID=2528024 RepID=UPI00119F70FC|nr:hypothetical protein [Lacipirellula limnantheis]
MAVHDIGIREGPLHHQFLFNLSRRHGGSLAFTIAWCCYTLAGCGSSGPYELAPVSGGVTLNGKAVPHTQIIFQPKGTPDNPSPGPGSTAFCDDAGRFELKTVRGEPGAVVGPHGVQIYAHGPAKSVAKDADDGPQVKEAFPAKYNVESQLTFDVPAEGSAAANFELTE